MILREQLKVSSKSLHDIVENQFPFSKLSSEIEIDKHALLCLSGFKKIFFNFLSAVQGEHSFYKASFEALKPVPLDEPCDNCNIDKSSHILAYKYVFLGSRMGNEILSKKNPQLLETKYGQYFSTMFPTDLWKEFRLELSLNDKIACEVIKKVNSIFQSLIDFGVQIEKK